MRLPIIDSLSIELWICVPIVIIVRKNNSSIKEYILKTKSISNHLAAIGEVVPDQDLIIYVVQGLDPIYLTFISSLSIQFRSLSFDKFILHLLSHEKMVMHQ